MWYLEENNQLPLEAMKIRPKPHKQKLKTPSQTKTNIKENESSFGENKGILDTALAIIYLNCRSFCIKSFHYSHIPLFSSSILAKIFVVCYLVRG